MKMYIVDCFARDLNVGCGSEYRYSPWVEANSDEEAILQLKKTLKIISILDVKEATPEQLELRAKHKRWNDLIK